LPINPDALALANKINKKFGEGTVVIASEIRVKHRFTTGSFALDVTLGGGWPANQWVEVIGVESSGKTAIVLKTIAANQALDPNFTTFWIAAEPFDEDHARGLGVDMSRVLVHSTQVMEEAYEAMLDMADSRAVDCIVLDSYPALIADEEKEKKMDEVVVALGARLTGKFFRKAGHATKRSLVEEERPMLGIIINQYRDQIGGFSPYGTPKTTPGGKAKNYAFYTRLEVKRAEYIEVPAPGGVKKKVGQTIKCTTIKNKSAPPMQVATIDFYFADAPEKGFKRGEYDLAREYATYAILYVMENRGAWYIFGEDRWQGKQAVLDAVAASPELRDRIKQAVMKRISLESAAESE
jgi:recombination protein RecA